MDLNNTYALGMLYLKRQQTKGWQFSIWRRGAPDRIN